MIEVQKLTKNYDSLTAVDEVSFTIKRGEIVGLLGHNGAGKTTIMKMMTGYLEPSAGSIQIDDLDIADKRTEIQAKIGYLPENCPLYPEMTVIDYLDYAASLRGLNGDVSNRAVREVIQQTELEIKAVEPIHTLSRGYRQRVGVAQAILNRPEVLILDEPTNGLDPSQILHMRELIQEFGRGNATVIISTHILQEVQAICDRVLIIRDGKLALDIQLNELQNSRRLLLTVDCKPEDAQRKLGDINGVNSVELISLDNGKNQYALGIELTDIPIAETVPSIAKTIINSGYSLYSINTEVRDLETVFKEVNSVNPKGEESNVQ